MMEVEDTGVFEITIQNAFYLDFYSGLQAADAAHIQLNLNAGEGGFLELFNQARIDQRINLRANTRLFAFARPLGFKTDQIGQAFSHIERYHAGQIKAFGGGFIIITRSKVTVAYHADRFASNDEADFRVRFVVLYAVNHLHAGLLQIARVAPATSRCAMKQGLVLVTGATGSGKSTTLACSRSLESHLQHHDAP